MLKKQQMIARAPGDHLILKLLLQTERVFVANAAQPANL
jgi:hypothetical protein